MKTRFCGFLIAVTVWFTGAAAAHAQVLENSANVNVPFEFYVGDQKMPAGDYRIQVDTVANTVVFHALNGSDIATVAAEYSIPTTTPERATLVFDQYAGRNFLRSVPDGVAGLNVRLPEPNSEKSLLR